MSPQLRRRQRSRRAARAVAPVLGFLLAGGFIWQATSAAFSTTTSASTNAWTTGEVELANNGGGASYQTSTSGLFGETALAPGASGAKCVTVESTGSVPGQLRFYAASATTNQASDQLQLTVQSAPIASSANVASDCTGWPTSGTATAYSGALSSLPASFGTATAGPNVAAGNQRIAYRVAWTLNSTANDNAMQGQTASADFVWEIQSS